VIERGVVRSAQVAAEPDEGAVEGFFHGRQVCRKAAPAVRTGAPMALRNKIGA